MIKKILVSQPKPTTEKSPYFEIEKKYGVKIDFRPLIHVEGLSPKEFRAQKINILDYTAVVFNSRHAINFFFSLCKEMRIQIPETMKYFFISEKVSLYVQKYIQYRKRKVFFSEAGTWDDLVNLMLKHKKERFFMPKSDVRKPEIAQSLGGLDLDFTEGTMYRTVSTIFDKKEPFDYDMLVFFTPSGAISLKDNFPDYKQGDIKFGCFGDATATKLEELGFRVDLKAPTATSPSMTGAIDEFLSKKK